MAPHSSILAWRIPWTEEPGGLQSTGLQSQTRLSDFTHSLTHSLSGVLCFFIQWQICYTLLHVGSFCLFNLAVQALVAACAALVVAYRI